MNQTVKYGSYLPETVEEMCRLLTIAGHPATPYAEFNWHHYTRVLQFQLRMARTYTEWNIDDIDGICGPKTWTTLYEVERALKAASDKSPPPVEDVPAEDKPIVFPGVEYVRDSPNQSSRNSTITHIVLHNTAGEFNGSISWLCNPQARASAHLVISRNGQTAKLVPFQRKAWHAGNGRINACSIGIELEAFSSERRFTSAMADKTIAWIKWLMKEYDIPAENIGIHRWYRNTSCPGLIWPTDEEFKRWRHTHFGA